MATYSTTMVGSTVSIDISRRDSSNSVSTNEAWVFRAVFNALEVILRSSVASNVDLAAGLVSPATFAIPSDIRVVVLTGGPNEFPTFATLPEMLPKSLIADVIGAFIGMILTRANGRNPGTARMRKSTVLEDHHGGAA